MIGGLVPWARPRRRVRHTLAAAAVAVVVIAGCGDDGEGGDAEPPPTRAEAATAVADGVVVPAYRDLATAADELVTAVTGTCDRPGSATLTAAQEAWRAVDTAWASTRSFRYGPTKEMRAVTRIDYPIDPEKVADLLAGDEPVDVDALAELGADRRGLGAVEVVLFAAAPPDPRACEFAVAASTLVADAARTLVADWEAATTDTDMAIEDGINGIIFALADVGDMQLARAAGVASGTPDPGSADTGPARAALPAMIAMVGGVEATWSASYRALVAGVDDDTAETVDEQLADVRDALAEIPAPLADVTDVETVVAAYDAVRALLVTLRTEVASQLGVTLQLSDADGDS